MTNNLNINPQQTVEFILPTYNVSNSSPIEDLIILENLYNELSAYSSTIIDKKYTTFSKECAKRLAIVASLIGRANDDLVKEKKVFVDVSEDIDMSTLSIDDLYHSYLCWRERHKEREVAGREHMTFFYEGRIVCVGKKMCRE